MVSTSSTISNLDKLNHQQSRQAQPSTISTSSTISNLDKLNHQQLQVYLYAAGTPLPELCRVA
jgi:hypothetical protein